MGRLLRDKGIIFVLVGLDNLFITLFDDFWRKACAFLTRNKGMCMCLVSKEDPVCETSLFRLLCLCISQMDGTLMICSSTTRRSTASYQLMTAACPRIRKFIVCFLSTFLCISKGACWSKSKSSQSSASFPGFRWSGTTLKSFLREKHVLPSWRRKLKQVPRTRPAWLWRTMSALRRRSIPLWWEGRETLTHSAGENET